MVISSLTPRKPRDDRRAADMAAVAVGVDAVVTAAGGTVSGRRAAAPVSEQQAAPQAPLKEAEDKPLYGKIERDVQTGSGEFSRCLFFCRAGQVTAHHPVW